MLDPKAFNLPWTTEADLPYGEQPRIYDATGALVAVVGNAEVDKQDDWERNASAIVNAVNAISVVAERATTASEPVNARHRLEQAEFLLSRSLYRHQPASLEQHKREVSDFLAGRSTLSTATPADVAELVGRAEWLAAGQDDPHSVTISELCSTLLSLSARCGEMERAQRPMRTGDTVYHLPSREEWIVAWADHSSGYMAPCGWPECQASISDCRILQRASDAVCEKLMADLEKSGRKDAHRARAALSRRATEGE